MYLDLKEKYWWYGLKRDVAEYVALCDTCQRVKAEHQRPTGLLQPIKKPGSGKKLVWILLWGYHALREVMIQFG